MTAKMLSAILCARVSEREVEREVVVSQFVDMMVEVLANNILQKQPNHYFLTPVNKKTS